MRSGYMMFIADMGQAIERAIDVLKFAVAIGEVAQLWCYNSHLKLEDSRSPMSKCA